MNKSSYPLVSVITGYYNRKENLAESIQSVLNQDYPNFEFIVFDDCSTDGTKELLQHFKGKDERFYLIEHEQNIGFTKGIIQAISFAKGKYIAIHGAGDISFPLRIRKQVELLESNPTIGIAGCLIEDIYDGDTHLYTPLTKNGDYNFSQGEVMYRKSLYYQVGGYNALFKYGQFTMLKLDLIKISKAAYIEEVLYKRIHYSNGVTRNNKRKLEQIISYTIGKNISKYGFLRMNTAIIIVGVTLRQIDLLKPGSMDEVTFLHHINWKMPIVAILYKLYRMKALPTFVLRKYGSLLLRTYHIV